MADSFYVVNMRGESEPFSLKKIYRSARRAGASAVLARKTAAIIQKQAYPGIKTSEIFKKIKKLLSREKPASALKMSLKEGMRKLGPTGFPFEKYVGEILSRNGFEVRLNQHIPGFCSRSYEIDFLARKDQLLYVGECKYHNLLGGRVHLDVALSNYARFLDIQKGNYFRTGTFKNLETKSLLVTNTKFTTDSIRYSGCVGVKLLGWNSPRGKGLEHLIDVQKLYPITILPSLNRYLAGIFVSRKIMLAQDLLQIDVVKFARATNAPKESLESLIKEAKILLQEQ
jgi:hypothetical protein